MQNRDIDNNHEQKKAILKVVGPLVLGVGILCIAIALLDFFGVMRQGMSGMGSFGHMDMRGPKYFGLFFLGAPLIVVGLVMCQFAFMGDVARYTSQEISPVAKDTFNYMADGTKEGIKNVASAIHEGIRGERAKSSGSVLCHNCQTANDDDAKFCKSCAAKLQQKCYCSRCGQENDRDARFCDNCGNELE